MARRFGAAPLLGLPAALLAHVLVFGGQHTAGGSEHAWFLEAGFAFGFLGTLAAVVATLCRGRAIAPRFLAVAGGAVLWFTAIELCERGGHGVPPVVSLAAIAFAAWLVRAVVYAFANTADALAGALRFTFVTANPRCAARMRNEPPPHGLLAHRLRLFSRPPPAFS